MSDTEGILRAALEHALNRTPVPYAEADTDLHEVVAETSKVVQELTDGHAEILLDPQGTSDDGAIYQLYVEWTEPDNPPQRKLLAILTIPFEGYPISTQSGSVLFSNREQIVNWMLGMVQDQDSALIRYLVFWNWRAQHYPAASSGN